LKERRRIRKGMEAISQLTENASKVLLKNAFNEGCNPDYFAKYLEVKYLEGI
jgi:hypothetical protein